MSMDQYISILWLKTLNWINMVEDLTWRTNDDSIYDSVHCVAGFSRTVQARQYEINNFVDK